MQSYSYLFQLVKSYDYIRYSTTLRYFKNILLCFYFIYNIKRKNYIHKTDVQVYNINKIVPQNAR